MSRLSKYEKETIIVFNEAEQNATLETANESLKNRLDRFCAEDERISLTKTNDCFKTYNLPKKWIKVKMPKKISAEERQKMADTARERFAKAKLEKQ